MAGKGRFHIPSAREMEKMEDRTEKVKSLFQSHIANKSSTEKPSATNPPLGNSSINNKTSNVIQQSVSGSSKQRPTVSDVPSGTGIEVRDQQSKAVTPGSSTDIRPAEKDSTTLIAQSSSDDQVVSSEGANSKPGKTNSIIVNTRQKGNPILKHVRNVPWEFGDIVPDYVLGQTTCALYLSLRYNALNPNYIHERFKQLGHSYALRVLLVQVDTKDPQFALKALAKVCILADCTLILAWTAEEAGRYLETYKSFEVKPPDLIMEKTDSNYMSQLTDTLTAVKKVNKTDAMTLLTAFGSLEHIVLASEEDLSLCPGFGPQKAKRLHSVFHEPFIKSKKSKPEDPPSPTKKVTASPRKKKMDAS